MPPSVARSPSCGTLGDLSTTQRGWSVSFLSESTSIVCFSHLQVLPEALLIWTYLLPPKPPPIRFSRHIVHTCMNMLWRVGARLPAPPTSTLEDSSEWLPLLRSHITTPFPPPAHSRLPSAVRSTHYSLPLDGNISRAGIQLFISQPFLCSGAYRFGCLLFLGTWEGHKSLLPCS